MPPPGPFDLEPTGPTQAGSQRLVDVLGSGGALQGANSKRTTPAPWVDCAHCGRRHYPSTTRGRWYIATTCLSCGAALEGVEPQDA